uniref:HTH CENPB-type domain-containing protein n=1 Tax=Hanusia phi TaxID=3032 RepID=A0A7S0HGM0_9CRYP|mmetsp:Transcript_17759/g.40197  ORF Transcript_17759/g.40197 Transcript_17759/m.40197 type:complete len:259 (+) Transcript_17759:103-879(+)|eukprot:753012-Hanusia_phi.AAC.2
MHTGIWPWPTNSLLEEALLHVEQSLVRTTKVRTWSSVLKLSTENELISSASISEEDADAESKPFALAEVPKRRHVWTETAREQHKQACKAKGKLTLGQKLEIVRRHEARDPEDHKTQAQLAAMFGKSRSAISKILRPENISKLKKISDTGIHPGVKRFSPAQHPELEKRMHQFALEAASRGACRRAQLCKIAEAIAKEMGILNFRATHGWYSRFVRRHGLAKSPRENAASPELAANATNETDLVRGSSSSSNSSLVEV